MDEENMMHTIKEVMFTQLRQMFLDDIILTNWAKHRKTETIRFLKLKLTEREREEKNSTVTVRRNFQSQLSQPAWEFLLSHLQPFSSYFLVHILTLSMSSTVFSSTHPHLYSRATFPFQRHFKVSELVYLQHAHRWQIPSFLSTSSCAHSLPPYFFLSLLLPSWLPLSWRVRLAFKSSSSAYDETPQMLCVPLSPSKSKVTE